MDDEAKKEILEAIKSSNARIDEVLEAVGAFASDVDKQFGEMRSEITGIKSEITGIKSEITGIKSEITGIKSVMVTKDFLQDQLGLLKGDLTVMMRGEDKKIIALVELMEKKQILTRDEARAFYEMEPFPKLMI